MTFVNTEVINYLFLNGKRIFQEHKIRIAREMTRQERNTMQKAIDEAKSDKADSKVTIDWVAPAAYVNGNRVWPIKNPNRPLKVNAVGNKAAPKTPYANAKPAELALFPTTKQFSAEIEPVSGHEFFAALMPWNDPTTPKEIIEMIITDPSMPFSITDRDNVIYAGARIQNGKVVTATDDGGEKGAGTNLLLELEKRNVVNVLLVVFRKFGRYQLGPDRFRIFNGLANKVLDNLVE